MARYNEQDHLSKDTLSISAYLEYNPKYLKLSNSARRLYAILLKRYNWTKHNHEKYTDEVLERGEEDEFTFKDEFGDLFCLISNAELQFWMRKATNFPSETTIITLKKELRRFGLIEEVKQGAWRPNKLYVNMVEMDPRHKEMFNAEKKSYIAEMKKKKKERNENRPIRRKTERKKNLTSERGLTENPTKDSNSHELKKIEAQRAQVNVVPSTKECTSIFNGNSYSTVNNLFVNKKESEIYEIIKNICAEFYDTEAQSRWNNYQWDVLIDSYIRDNIHRIVGANDVYAYIRASISKICVSNGIKNSELGLFKYRKNLSVYDEIGPKTFLSELIAEEGEDGVIEDLPLHLSKLVDHLRLDLKIPASVINVLFEFVLRYTNGYLPDEFLRSVVATWRREKIETASDAVEFVENCFRKQKGYRFKVGKLNYSIGELYERDWKEVADTYGTTIADERVGANFEDYHSKLKETRRLGKGSRLAETIPSWFGKDLSKSQMSEAEAAAAVARMEEVREKFLQENRL